MRISDLKDREIINFSDGRRMGNFDDLELDVERGLIKALIISGRGGFFGFFQEEQEFVVPWEKIVKFGQDVIIADLSLNLEKDFKKDDK